MKKNDKSLAAIDKAIEEAKKKYAEECAAICNSKGYEQKNPKWKAKIDKAADKFAKRFLDLMEVREEITGVSPENIEDPRDWFVGKK